MAGTNLLRPGYSLPSKSFLGLLLRFLLHLDVLQSDCREVPLVRFEYILQIGILNFPTVGFENAFFSAAIMVGIVTSWLVFTI